MSSTFTIVTSGYALLTITYTTRLFEPVPEGYFETRVEILENVVTVPQNMYATNLSIGIGISTPKAHLEYLGEYSGWSLSSGRHLKVFGRNITNETLLKVTNQSPPLKVGDVIVVYGWNIPEYLSIRFKVNSVDYGELFYMMKDRPMERFFFGCSSGHYSTRSTFNIYRKLRLGKYFENLVDMMSKGMETDLTFSWK